MTKRLTQADVDALLSGSPPSAAGAAVEVVPYNFQRPPRVVKEQRAALEAAFTRFAYVLQSFLTARLRTPVDVALRGVEELPYGEFLLSLEDPCTAFVFHAGAENAEQGIINLDNRLAFYLVDRLFGGTGDVAAPTRALTTLEQSAVLSVVERALAVLGEVWGDRGAIGALLGFESSPDALRLTMPDASVLVTSLDLRAGPFTSFLVIYLPLAALDGALHVRGAPRAPVPSTWRRSLAEALRRLRVTVTAQLPPVRFSARTIAGLRVGQVLEPRAPLDTPVEVRVNGELRYVASLGQLRRRLALQITSIASAPPDPTPAARHRRVV